MSDPIVMRPQVGQLTLSGNDFHCQVVVGLVTVDQPENRMDAMCGSVVSYGNELAYLDLTYFQDWSSGGISHFLWNQPTNATATFAFSPTDGTPAMAGTVTLRKPATFGGPPNAPAVDHVRLACVGLPTQTPG